MIKKLLVTTSAALLAAGSALAQTATSETTAQTGATTSMFSTWDQSTQDAFFTDGTLRSEAELRTGWDSLDTAQQEQLRADCQSMTADATGGGAQTETDTSAAAGTTTSEGTSSETTASTTTTGEAGTAGADMPDMASLQELCRQVDTF